MDTRAAFLRSKGNLKMCIPAMGGGPFGPASVLPRPPASRTRTDTARRSTRLTLPPAEGAAPPGLTRPPQPGSAAAALPIGRLLQLGGLAAGAAQGASRTAPASRTAQVPQPVPATPSPVPQAPRANMAADAGSDGRLILKQVAQGKMRPVDAILGFEDLLARRNVSPDARRELTLTFGESLARATRQRFSVHRAMQQLRVNREVTVEPTREGPNRRPVAPNVADSRNDAAARRNETSAPTQGDQLDRGNILPLAFDRRTGELVFAVPNSVMSAIDAAKLPGDVLFGRVDPNSPDALRRAFDLGAMVSGGSFVARASPASVAAGARRPPKPNPGTDLPTVEIKTSTRRASNAERGTPEFKALNNPDPDSFKSLDTGQKFRTNAFGFVEHINFKPVRDKRGRAKLQTDVGKLGRDTDVGGHLQAARHGGPSDRFNLFPQDGRFNNSEFKVFENMIDANLDKVERVSIDLVRKDPSNPRPDALEVEYVIEGVTNRLDFKNEAGG